MKIEAGKYYKTRDGRKVGPMSVWYEGFIEKDGDARIWNLKGEPYGSDHNGNEFLYQEWSEGPIRTVTRREPVQGNYGIVAITKRNKIMIAAGHHSHEELEEAAHILNQLAEVKRENGK